MVGSGSTVTAGSPVVLQGNPATRLRRRSRVVTTTAQLKEVVDAYLDFDAFAFDFETRGEKRNDPRHAIPFWLSLAGPGRSDVIPFGHPLGRVTGFEWSKLKKDGEPYKNARRIPIIGAPPAQLTTEEVFEVLEPLFFGPALKIGHGLKFDLEVASRYYGSVPPVPYFDTMIAAFLINESYRGGRPYSLGTCVEREFRYVYDKSLGRIGVDTFPFQEAANYARHDAKYTWLLWRRYAARIEAEGLEALLDLEMQVLEAVVWMEEAGVAIDVPGLEDLTARIGAEMEDTYERINKAAGWDAPINLNANAQVAKLVFEQRGHRSTVYTEKRRDAAVSQEALTATAKLRKDFVVKDILHWQELHKLYATYLLNMKDRLYNGRLHADFDQRGTRTGRFSCRQPNLQNVPVRRAKDVRDLFVAPPGCVLVVADYSQIELRMLAHFSRDPVLIQAYEEGLDLHRITAQRAYHVEEPTDLQRSLAKNCNFSIAFGAVAMTLVTRYGVPNEREGQMLIDAFYGTYKRVGPWRESVIRKCKRSGISKAEARRRGCRQRDPFVTTILGRRRQLPDILMHWDWKRMSAAERQAVNTVIQGSAGDLIKLAMVRTHQRLHETPAKLVLTVHDELVLQTPESMVEEATEIMRQSMEDVPLSLRVPLVASINVTDCWSKG